MDPFQAKQQLKELQSKITFQGLKTLVWLFSKHISKALSALQVDHKSVSMLKALM